MRWCCNPDRTRFAVATIRTHAFHISLPHQSPTPTPPPTQSRSTPNRAQRKNNHIVTRIFTRIRMYVHPTHIRSVLLLFGAAVRACVRVRSHKKGAGAELALGTLCTRVSCAVGWGGYVPGGFFGGGEFGSTLSHTAGATESSDDSVGTTVDGVASYGHRRIGHRRRAMRGDRARAWCLSAGQGDHQRRAGRGRACGSISRSTRLIAVRAKSWCCCRETCSRFMRGRQRADDWAGGPTLTGGIFNNSRALVLARGRCAI